MCPQIFPTGNKLVTIWYLISTSVEDTAHLFQCDTWKSVWSLCWSLQFRFLYKVFGIYFILQAGLYRSWMLPASLFFSWITLVDTLLFLPFSDVVSISQASGEPLDTIDSPSMAKPQVQYHWDWETLLQWQISAAGHLCTECTNQFTVRPNQREQKACELCQQSVPWKYSTSRSNERHNFKGIAYQCKYVNPHPS